MDMDKGLLSGSTPLLILALLRDRDLYGYEMVAELARRSQDAFRLKEGTLYPLLHAMEKKHWLRAYTRQTESGRQRRYYSLTQEGRAQLEQKQAQWWRFSQAVDQVLLSGN